MPNAAHPRHAPRLVVPVFIFLALAVAGAGVLLTSRRHHATDAELHLRLSTAAELKAMQVAAWRGERREDAQVQSANVTLMPAVLRLLEGRANGEEKLGISNWLKSLCAQYRYENAVLTAPSGEIILSAGSLQGDAAYYRSIAREIGESAEPTRFGGITPSGTDPARPGPPRQYVAGKLKKASGETAGALVLGIDPEHDVYPALLDWPGSGRTGELLLVHKADDALEYLNAPRMGPGQLFRRRPLSQTYLPGVRAVLGESDRLDGVDYRGQNVLAEACAVPDSDWIVLAKMDRSEAFAEENRDKVQLTILLTILVLLGSAVAGLLMRSHEARTYREKYEAELARQSLLGRYNFLTKYANDAIVVWEGSGRIVDANDRATAMFGYSREELLQLRLPDLKPQDFEAEFRKLEGLIRDRRNVVFETVNRRKNGTAFPTEVSACLIDFETVPHFVSIFRDISERKQAEHQINRLNHLYAVLSHCNSAIVRATTEQGLFDDVCRIAVNSGGFRLAWIGRVDRMQEAVVPVTMAGPEAGYLQEVRIRVGEHEEALGPTGRCIVERRGVACTDFTTDPAMKNWREDAARHGLRSSMSLPLTRRGEAVFIFGIYSSEPGFFSAEEIALAEEVGESISMALDRLDLQRERLQAEERLRITHERLELALDAANEAYWDWIVETDTCYLSPRFYSITGYAWRELRSGHEALTDVVHPEDRGIVARKLECLLNGTAKSTVAEYRLLHKDGHSIWVLGSAKVAEANPDGTPRRIVGTRVDISQRKLLEMQFLQAQKMESVGRLASGVAHDFNNFLTVINGYTALLLDEVPPGSPFAKHLAAIQEAGDRSAALTRQLLAFSRKDVEQPEPLDPNAIIRGLQKMVGRVTGGNVQLRLELAPDAGIVLADPTHLEQVIMNLTINARDAISDSGTILVETRRVDLPEPASPPNFSGPFVRLTVADNGCGMTPEVQSKIFEPFFTTKAKGRGTGLGLATVYSIVARCGGFIRVESDAGKGSAFHVYLPCVNRQPAAPAHPPGAKTAARAEGTVLVVEDRPTVLALAVEILKQSGYRVLAAAGGTDALAISQNYRGRIDVVLSDILMPGMSGPELVAQLLKSRPGIKVVYVSGSVDETVQPEDLTAAGAILLNKPYKPESLLARMREALSRPPAGGNDEEKRETA